jgi:transposase
MRFIHDLSDETTHLLQKLYKHSRHHRVRQRAHCVLLSFQGYTPKELAHIFHVDRITIYNWLDAWEAQRFPGLYDRQGKGRPPSFTQDQKAQIRQWAQLFPKHLNKIGILIREEFALDVSKQTIKRVLKSWRFSWRRRRKKVKGQPDPGEYQTKRAALEMLREEDQHGIIDLRYFDESGFCLTPYIPYAWQEQGATIALESTPSKRLNVLGFLNKRHELAAYRTEGSVTSEVVIQCFDDFCAHLQVPTVVVIDNASIHTSGAFQKKLDEWESKGLAIFYLPEYSPELNLIEILWRFMKYEWIELWAYASWHHLVEYVKQVIENFGEKYKINFV